jgi:hypothetical protein
MHAWFEKESATAGSIRGEEDYMKIKPLSLSVFFTIVEIIIFVFIAHYNSPQKLDRVIRCMIAYHRRKGETTWTGTCEGAMMQHSRPG